MPNKGIWALSRHLPILLDAAIEDELFDTPDPDDPDAATMMRNSAASGACTPFASAISELVLPGLEHFGVDVGAGNRWLDERVRKGNSSA